MCLSVSKFGKYSCDNADVGNRVMCDPSGTPLTTEAVAYTVNVVANNGIGGGVFNNFIHMLSMY